MVLKNKSSTDRSIFFMRYADVDVSGTSSNNFDATANSAFGWDSSDSTPPLGLILQNVGNTNGLTPIPFIQKTGAGPVPCAPSNAFTFGPLLATDGSVVMFCEGTSKVQVKNGNDELSRDVDQQPADPNLGAGVRRIAQLASCRRSVALSRRGEHDEDSSSHGWWRRLQVVEAGNPRARPILFIHGTSQCWLQWTLQLNSSLADSYRLIALDVRSHGLSDKPRDA